MLEFKHKFRHFLKGSRGGSRDSAIILRMTKNFEKRLFNRAFEKSLKLKCFIKGTNSWKLIKKSDANKGGLSKIYLLHRILNSNVYNNHYCSNLLK